MTPHPSRTYELKALLSGLALGLILGGGAPALALDTVSPASVAAAAGDACPALTAIKYPWLTCSANEWGGVTLKLPGQTAPPECYFRLADGECAASPEPWQLDTPIIGPEPTIEERDQERFGEGD